MEICNSYHGMKEKQKKNSPTKLKQMQIKLNIFDRQQHNDSSKSKKMIVYFGH